ncbi:MAG: hypothetical protein ACE5I5_06475 [Candidatus Heimdallarchaeota archaeon]
MNFIKSKKEKGWVVVPFFDPRVEKKEEPDEGMCAICGEETELPYRWPLNVDPRLVRQICERCKVINEHATRKPSG